MSASKRHHRSKSSSRHQRSRARPTAAGARDGLLRDLRKTLYLCAIVDGFWFEGDIPDDPTVPFTMLTNSDWPHPSQVPADIEGLGKLKEPQLLFIFRQLQRPTWTTGPNVGRSTVTMAEVLTGIGRGGLLNNFRHSASI